MIYCINNYALEQWFPTFLMLHTPKKLQFVFAPLAIHAMFYLKIIWNRTMKICVSLLWYCTVLIKNKFIETWKYNKLLKPVLFIFSKVENIRTHSSLCNVFWRSSKWVLSSSLVILPALSLNLFFLN